MYCLLNELASGIPSTHDVTVRRRKLILIGVRVRVRVRVNPNPNEKKIHKNCMFVYLFGAMNMSNKKPPKLEE